MTTPFPQPPAAGTPLSATHASAEARELLALRRSAGKMTLAEPGPDHTALNDLLTVAMRVPDHRRVEPWRFIVIDGERRQLFGEAIAAIYTRANPDADAETVARNATRLPLRAPVVIAIVSSPDASHKTPVWEQELSVGAACQNLLLAANAAGWAGVWLTEWIAYDREVASLLSLSMTERIAGFIYLGTSTAEPPERARPTTASKISHWSPNSPPA